MPSSAGAARGPNGLQFLVHVGGRPGGRRPAQPLEHAQRVLAFAIAESTGTLGIFRDRFTHDVTLGLAEARGRLPNLRDRLIVQRESDACHNVAILP